jgi:hypothetical protein
MGHGAIAGLLRDQEWVQGTALNDGTRIGYIAHALHITVDPNSYNNGSARWGRNYVWPTYQLEHPDLGAAVGNLWEGSLVAIPPDGVGTLAGSTLNAVVSSLPIQCQMMAHALQDYGGYVGDSGGNTYQADFATEGANWTNLTSAEQMAISNGLDTIAKYIMLVSNSFNPTTGGPPRNGVKIDGGDGTLRKPVAPPFDARWGGGR